MKTIELQEIEKLYSNYHIKVYENHSIRNTLNEGTMNNKLNCNYSFINKSFGSANKLTSGKAHK